MNDNDKNLHLSPLLDKIRDYGPGDVTEEESEEKPEEQQSEAATEAAPETEPQPEAEPESADKAPQEPAEPPPASPPPATAPAKSSKLPVYSLMLLWLLTLAGGFGAFVWQQTRIDALAVELRDERGKGRDLVAAAEREATRLADRVTELDDTIAQLRMALSDAQSEAAALAIFSVEAARAPEPTQDTIEQAPAPGPTSAPDPEPAPEIEESAAAPIEVAIPTPETAAPEQAVTDAVAEPAPAGPWYINLSTLSSRAAAENWLAELRGVPERAEIIAVQSGGKTLYRVRVGGYASREDAVGLAEGLGVSGAWASKG